MDSQDSRPYDLVVFGATGFTGALVAEYLAGLDASFSWPSRGAHRPNLKT